MGETKIGPYGIAYKKYAGKVWVSSKLQGGFNVAIVNENGLKVLSYIHGDEEKTVNSVLKAYGWTEQYAAYLLAEPEEIATCNVCGKDFYEGDINLIDYEDDVCVSCEPRYKELMEVVEKAEIEKISE